MTPDIAAMRAQAEAAKERFVALLAKHEADLAEADKETARWVDKAAMLAADLAAEKARASRAEREKDAALLAKAFWECSARGQHKRTLARKEQAETAEAALAAERRHADEMAALVRCLVENDPDEPIADGGHVLDLWRQDAARALAVHGASRELPHER